MAKLVIFISYLFVTFAGYWLACLNLSHLKKHGASIPPEFEGHIDQELLRKTRDYVAENTRFEIITSIFHAGLTVIFLFGNFLNIYNSWVVSLKAPFVFSGLIFFLLLLCAEIILTIPFKLYHTFKIENKYGFTTTTKKLWITDLLKSTALSAILMSILISAGLFIVHTSPNLWWFWVWCLFLAFSIMIMYIFP
ncbi:MAG: M48 family peptidase, partial [Candidatus Brocadiaceae bacterium]